VVERGGDHVLPLKGNQGSLHDDVRCFLDDPTHIAELARVSVDGGHGRIETRASLVSTDIAWLQERHVWPGLAATGRVLRTLRQAPSQRPVGVHVRSAPQASLDAQLRMLLQLRL